jgi:hypothetical protein
LTFEPSNGNPLGVGAGGVADPQALSHAATPNKMQTDSINLDSFMADL